MNSTSRIMRLEGNWRISCDPENMGRHGQWFNGVRPDAAPAPVPGVIQQVFPRYHGVVWYWLSFTPLLDAGADDSVRIYFGAVDYMADLWLNGCHIGGHEGGETPFDFDITSALKNGEGNLLAVRVLNPRKEPIDGVSLPETPALCRVEVLEYQPGLVFNTGGILLPVELRIVPKIRIVDVFARPQLETGRIPVAITVVNDTGRAATGTLLAAVGLDKEPHQLDQADGGAAFPCGSSVHELELAVSQRRLWSFDDPCLYRVNVSLSAKGGARHESSVRCGFRDFRVVDGYFCLNGKRLFLKSTLTVNDAPVGWVVSPDTDFLRRDLLYAKSLGFNMVRSIACMMSPDQLDLCDELGLMVCEETHASWRLEDSPHMKARFSRSFREMILRDRNHPSVTIWGLLNETSDGPVFRHAVDTLQLVRGLDPTRLVLLNSGRWDCQAGIGSLSNPGGVEWEFQWGIEAAGATAVPDTSDFNAGGYCKDMGDIHVYPASPIHPKSVSLLRSLGERTKPIFLSEYGVGSLFNAIDELRRYEEAGADTDLFDRTLIREMADKLRGDWRGFGMEGEFPFPEDMLRESYLLQSRQRAHAFNIVRSNPRICGYSATGMLDCVFTGAGLWTFWRELKPRIAETLREGWAPLKWCLFASPMNGYVGGKIRLEAVLANEDVLPPGNYPVTFRVMGPAGLAWERSTTVRVPGKAAGAAYPLLAVPVLDATVNLSGPAGEYTFAACLEKGGAPAADRLTFHLSDIAKAPGNKRELTLWGIDSGVQKWLKKKGFTCRGFSIKPMKERELILVGLPPTAESGCRCWKELARRIARGAVAVFLSPAAFAKGAESGPESSAFWLPLERKGGIRMFRDWLYHKECVGKRRHPVFSGLKGGVLDNDFYDQVIGHDFFHGQETPDDVICAAFAVGYNCPGGYDSGVMIGAYRLGAGRIVLNTMNILENVDHHPAADQLLLNLVEYASNELDRPLGTLSKALASKIDALYPVYPYSEFKCHWEVAKTHLNFESIDLAPTHDAIDVQWQKIGPESSRYMPRNFVDFRNVHGVEADGMAYARGAISSPRDLTLKLLIGTDGPCKVWVDDEVVAVVKEATNPAIMDSRSFDIRMPKGQHTLTVAFDRRGGQAWGFSLRFVRVDDKFSREELENGQADVPIMNPTLCLH